MTSFFPKFKYVCVEFKGNTMIRGQTLPPFENKARTFAIPAQGLAGTTFNIWLRFIDNLFDAWRQIETREQLRRLSHRQLEDIGLTVAERDALAGLPRL